MKIQGDPGHNAHAYGQIKRQQQAQTEQINIAKSVGIIEDEASTHATSTDELNTGETKGVILHLQEGHYQGVAQLRLSIVHAESFQQAASLGTVEVLDAEGGKLIDDLRINLEVMKSSTEAFASLDVEGAIKAFEETVASDKEGPESRQSSIENFRGLYSKAFRALVDKIGPVDSQSASDITTAAQPMPSNEDGVNVTTDEIGESRITQPPQIITDGKQEQTGITVELVALKDWFNEALDSSVETIQNQVTTLSAPPLPSKPAGNGGAYEKSLAVYTEIYGTTEQQLDTIPPVETGTIDTEA